MFSGEFRYQTTRRIIDQATAKARQYSMNDADFFLVRAPVALDKELRMVMENAEIIAGKPSKTD